MIRVIEINLLVFNSLKHLKRERGLASDGTAFVYFLTYRRSEVI